MLFICVSVTYVPQLRVTSDWLVHNGECQIQIKAFMVFGFAHINKTTYCILNYLLHAIIIKSYIPV